MIHKQVMRVDNMLATWELAKFQRFGDVRITPILKKRKSATELPPHFRPIMHRKALSAHDQPDYTGGKNLLQIHIKFGIKAKNIYVKMAFAKR